MSRGARKNKIKKSTRLPQNAENDRAVPPFVALKRVKIYRRWPNMTKLDRFELQAQPLRDQMRPKGPGLKRAQKGPKRGKNCPKYCQNRTKTGQESQNFYIRRHNYARGWSLRQHIGLKWRLLQGVIGEAPPLKNTILGRSRAPRLPSRRIPEKSAVFPPGGWSGILLKNWSKQGVTPF